MENNKNSLVKNKNFVVIHGWMINELKLNGNELLTYSLIYGFTQTNEQWFTGSINYIAQWCNTSKRTIYTILKFLVNKNLIIKKDVEINNVKFCHYKANLDIIYENNTEKSTFYSRVDFQGGGEKISPVLKNNADVEISQVVKKFQGGGEKISPYNIDNNIDKYHGMVKEKKENFSEEKVFENIKPNQTMVKDSLKESEVKKTSLSFPTNSSSPSMEMCETKRSKPSSKKIPYHTMVDNFLRNLDFSLQSFVEPLRKWFEHKVSKGHSFENLGNLSFEFNALKEISKNTGYSPDYLVDWNIHKNYTKLFTPEKKSDGDNNDFSENKKNISNQKKEENNSKEVIENKPDVVEEEDDETSALKEMLKRSYDNSNPKHRELQLYFENLKIKKFNSKEIVLDFGNYGNSQIDLKFWRDCEYPLEDGTVKTVEGMKSKIENMLILYGEDGTSSKLEAKLYNRDYEEQF